MEKRTFEYTHLRYLSLALWERGRGEGKVMDIESHLQSSWRLADSLHDAANQVSWLSVGHFPLVIGHFQLVTGH